MKTIDEFLQYLCDFNFLSKIIIKSAIGMSFVLAIIGMYFAMAAGRTEDYYICMYYFEIIIENIKSILGIGCLFSLLLEPIFKKYNVK